MTDPLATLRQALGSSYRVERELGEGGMATVYLATDLKHNRPVAIKVLRPELATSLGPDRFLREIEIAAKLQHPNILPVYDSGGVGGLLYYVMPFIEGESLRDRIVRGGPLPPAEAVRITREVVDALEYAHRAGIVHRDIKPANILLSQGHAVIADFGIARAVSASASAGLTQVGIAVGTPAYMSPEQALGGADVDGRADIFAVGVMLFEMLEGSPPHEGTTPQAILSAALAGKRRRLTKDSLGVGPVIERALASEPGDRFATAAEMNAALEGVTTGSRPAGAAPRRRTILIAGAAVLIAAAAIAVWSRGYRAEGDPRRSLIVFPFKNQTGDPSKDYLENAAMNLLGLGAAHWADMRVFDDERTASLLRHRDIKKASDVDFEAARAMARDAKVGTLVLGDIRREGDSLAIEAKVHDVRSGNRLDTKIVRAPFGADPRPLFDQLAAQILGTAGAPPGERPSVLAQTTSSIEAYREYLAGTADLQRFQIDSAQRHLNRAVALDSNFALAYLRLRDAEGWVTGSGDRAKRRQFVLSAERHAASLPPRLRNLVAFHRAYEDGNFFRARQIVRDLIAKDPTDVEAWYQLGEASFHDAAAQYPHRDSAGNLGVALHAFKRSLALDSAYILAYQHIIDGLGNCAGSNVWVCLPDSAVYGTAAELSRRFGDARLKQLRDDDRAEQLATARVWINSAPTTPRARTALLGALFAQGRYDEALRETDAVARMGARGLAGAWRAALLVQQGKPGAAAAAFDSLLKDATDSVPDFVLQNVAGAVSVFSGGGGRLRTAQRYNHALFRALPGDSLNGPANVRMSKAELEHLAEGYALAETGLPETATSARELIQRSLRSVAHDTGGTRRVVNGLGATSLSAFLSSRDTTFLSAFLGRADTTNSSTWHVADAELALARGDSARARMRVERHYRHPAPGEFSGEQGVIRAFAWGDVLSRLGEPRLAVEALARIDSSDARVAHPGYMVRSFAERGALYQRLGEKERAVEFYGRFIDAWKDGDPPVQPAVERARNAVAMLRGAPAAPSKTAKP